MNKNLTQIRDENEGAFTLIELLVVILIIGILAAIAIPAFLNQRKAAVDSSVQSDVKNAATQIETWMVSNPSTDIPNMYLVDNGSGTEIMGELYPDVHDGLGEGIRVGDNTELYVYGGSETGTYIIEGYNEGGDQAATVEGILFESENGGLQN